MSNSFFDELTDYEKLVFKSGLIYESKCSSCGIDYYFKFPLTEEFCNECDPRTVKPYSKKQHLFTEEDRLLKYTHPFPIIEPSPNPLFSVDGNRKYYRKLSEMEYHQSPKYKAWHKSYMEDYRQSFVYKAWRKGYWDRYRAGHGEQIKSWRQNYRKTSLNFRSWIKSYRSSPEQKKKSSEYKMRYLQTPRGRELNRLASQRNRERRKLLENVEKLPLIVSV